MIKGRLSTEVQRLTGERTPFVVATVVRARRPTSVQPGDAAIVLPDGRLEGFVGGVCAETSVRLHSLRALETGEPLLLALVPGDAEGPDPETTDGAVVERNPCLSGGSMEIFLEPHLPSPTMVILGGSPIAEAIEQLAQAAGYHCRRTVGDSPEDVAGASAVIVASHGSGEESVLSAALLAGVPYVALVASPRRGGAVRAELDVPGELSAQLHTPAGLDIGARTPSEIAISILAEVVAEQHADPGPGRPAAEAEEVAPPVVQVAVDPVCGMRVAVTKATAQLQIAGVTVFFCGEHCRDRHARAHAGDAGAQQHAGDTGAR